MADQDGLRSEIRMHFLHRVTSSPHDADLKGDRFGLTIEPPSAVVIALILGDFRFEYEYEIAYEYDFSNLERILKIITWHTNIAPKAFTLTDQQQGEATALGTCLVSYSYSKLKFSNFGVTEVGGKGVWVESAPPLGRRSVC